MGLYTGGTGKAYTWGNNKIKNCMGLLTWGLIDGATYIWGFTVYHQWIISRIRKVLKGKGTYVYHKSDLKYFPRMMDISNQSHSLFLKIVLAVEHKVF